MTTSVCYVSLISNADLLHPTLRHLAPTTFMIIRTAMLLPLRSPVGVGMFTQLPSSIIPAGAGGFRPSARLAQVRRSAMQGLSPST